MYQSHANYWFIHDAQESIVQGVVDVQREPTGHEVDEMLESIKALVVSGTCDELADDIRNKYLSPVSFVCIPSWTYIIIHSIFLSFYIVVQLGGEQKDANNTEIVLDGEYQQVSV